MVHYTFKSEGGVFEAKSDFLNKLIKIVKEKYSEAFLEIEQRLEDEMCPTSEYLFIKLIEQNEEEKFFIVPLDTQELILSFFKQQINEK